MNTVIKRSRALAGLTGGLFIFAQNVDAASGDALGIREAVNLALTQNPSIMAAKKSIDDAANLKNLAIASLTPNISLTGSFARKKDSVNNGSGGSFNGDAYNSYQYQFTGTQPLFAWGLLPALHATETEMNVRKKNLDVTIRSLETNVVSTFYQVLLNDRLLETLKRSRKVYQETLAVSEHRYKIGRGELLDVLTIKTDIALLDPKIQQAEDTLKTSAAQLATLLGDHNAKAIEIRGDLEAPSLATIDVILQSLKPYLPELESSRALIDELISQKSVASSSYWPSVNAVASWGKSGYKTNALIDDYSTAWSAGVQINIPIFSGLAFLFSARSYDAKIQVAEAQDVQLHDNTSLAQIQARENLDTANAVIRSSQLALDLAQQSVNEAQRKYRLATIDYLQLLTAEQNLLTADTNYDQAKFSYITALTTYFSAVGYPVDTLVDVFAKKSS